MAEGAILITGATGHLGTEVVAQLLTATDKPLYALVRVSSVENAARRLQALWWEDTRLCSSVGRRVIPIVGDITQSTLALPQDITHIIHCAAETGVQKSRDELWRINVEGTRNVVKAAEQISGLQRFTYISTAYVAGTQKGRIMEDAPLADSFYSLYEESKNEAERIVRATSLPFTICRPGMIVGHSQTGRTRNFNSVYYVMKLLLQGKMRLLPVSRHQTVNVIPVDDVARQVVVLTMHPQAEGRTFHLTAHHDSLPHVDELVEHTRMWAMEHLQADIPHPLYLPVPMLRAIGRSHNSGRKAKSHSLLSNLTALMPYFLDDHVFDRTNTDRLAGHYQMDWKAILPHLLEFACRHNFMRISDQSIFQQSVTRRKSRRHPITYYNISADRTEEYSGQEMNGIISHYVGILRQVGVKPGDRVALSGINCVEHTAIDSAIGLLGAVSVPIYYTTPPEELSLLLTGSGARCFFVGDERIMKSVERLNDSTVQVIPFGPLGGSWADGQAGAAIKHQSDGLQECELPDPNALATIRYTSGTTGAPKGVMFSFSQLKWMGEVLTNLLSWRDRNQEMRYLSFLPMSHVVEGILASYAPYCMLCRAKVYYLNDFQMLTRALPMVRPTVFFSVPRFYEKLWEQIEQSRLGRKYLAMSDGWLKRQTGHLIRNAVLRKAGLNRCSQLIVGSAPMSEELLQRFRKLGIEIHNAYGQTEAPLITLNRLGDNIIPSIGTPLPDTTVSTAEDGELIVSGPQVALGYYHLTSGTFTEGCLHTGDLGRIDDNGHVYISGRKKDMLITSYGKNINCTKIEQLLTDIPCVEHAVLVGEQRPYCTALIWTDTPTPSLQADIDHMNSHLSHPEQVKRFRIMATPLSISRGELTPNLKVKRKVVLEHYQQEIDEMYAE